MSKISSLKLDMAVKEKQLIFYTNLTLKKSLFKSL